MMTLSDKDARSIEAKELLDILTDSGYGDLLSALQDQKAYSKKGRLLHSVVARTLNTDYKKIKVMLERCQEILQPHI